MSELERTCRWCDKHYGVNTVPAYWGCCSIDCEHNYLLVWALSSGEGYVSKDALAKELSDDKLW